MYKSNASVRSICAVHSYDFHHWLCKHLHLRTILCFHPIKPSWSNIKRVSMLLVPIPVSSCKLMSGSLFLLAFPSATVLVSIYKTCLNLFEALSTEKYPIIRVLIFTPVKDFICVFTHITFFSSHSHKNIPWQTLSMSFSALWGYPHIRLQVLLFS